MTVFGDDRIRLRTPSLFPLLLLRCGLRVEFLRHHGNYGLSPYSSKIFRVSFIGCGVQQSQPAAIMLGTCLRAARSYAARMTCLSSG